MMCFLHVQLAPIKVGRVLDRMLRDKVYRDILHPSRGSPENELSLSVFRSYALHPKISQPSVLTHESSD